MKKIMTAQTRKLMETLLIQSLVFNPKAPSHQMPKRKKTQLEIKRNLKLRMW
jgi:hypothetical protein